MALSALICLQAMLLACSLVFAQSAADRAARGVSDEQVARSLPSGWRDQVTISRSGDRAVIRLTPPVVLPGVGDRLAIRATSEVVA